MSVFEVKESGRFHGKEYIVSVRIEANSSLSITVESKFEAEWWSNTFSAAYLEELTQKAGGRLSFSSFSNAVVNGLKQREENKSNLDILTFEDLQEMRNSSASAASSTTSTSNKKRYVIVTSSLENNDAIHYPLSLPAADEDSPQFLRDTLRRMKVEAEDLKEKANQQQQQQQLSDTQLSSKQSVFSSSHQGYQSQTAPNVWGGPTTKEFEQLRSENELLKTKMKRVESTTFTTKQRATPQNSHDTLAAVKAELEAELNNTKADSAKVIERLNNSIAGKEKELLSTRSEYSDACRQIPNPATSDPHCVLLLNEHLQRLTIRDSEVEKHRNLIAEQSLAIQRSTQEVEFYKLQEKRSKHRINQLEIELNATTYRVSSPASNRDRQPSPFSRSANSSRNSPVNRRAISVPSSKTPSPASRTAQVRGNSLSKSSTNDQSLNQSRRDSRITSTSPIQRNVAQTAGVFGNNNNYRPSNNSRVSPLRTAPVSSSMQNQHHQQQQNIFSRSRGQALTSMSSQNLRSDSLTRNQQLPYSMHGSVTARRGQNSNSSNSNYPLSSTDQNLLARIDEAARGKNVVKPEFSDAHITDSQRRLPKYYDPKLSNLQNLIEQGKRR